MERLREAWDDYVRFGLANPAVFAITNEIGSQASRSPAALTGIGVLRSRVQLIARTGRLRMGEDRAVALIHAAGVGAVSTLLSLPEEERDRRLSTEAREAVLAALLTRQPRQAMSGMTSFAIGPRAHLHMADVLTPGERLLLLDRLSRDDGSGGAGEKAEHAASPSPAAAQEK